MKLGAFQKHFLSVLDKKQYGTAILYWRRQGGKTTTLAYKALKWMAENPGCTVIFASASLNVGSEMPMRQHDVFRNVIRSIQEESSSVSITTNADKLSDDSFLDLFESGKFETTLWHSKSIKSRLKVIAANVATGRGFTGWLIVDEIGFIHDLKDFIEAVEPIASRNSAYRVLYSTTPPNDDSHYSYDLIAPPPGMIFTPSKIGTWYTSQAELPVHRVDGYDAELAGVPIYDKISRLPLSVEEARRKATDRDAFDRNYLLALPTGGAAAIQLDWLRRAQDLGFKNRCRYYENELPDNWWQDLDPALPVAIGADPATTENQKSNPFGLCVAQRAGADILAKVMLRFKTSNPRLAMNKLVEVAGTLRAKGFIVSGLGIDASSERFWAAEVVKTFSEKNLCRVILLVASEKITKRGEDYNLKSYTGSVVASLCEDGHFAAPPAREVRDDFRLVMRHKGSFDNLTDAAGNHGDLFDAAKAATYVLTEDSGDLEAAAMAVANQGLLSERCRPSFDLNHPERLIENPPDDGGTYA